MRQYDIVQIGAGRASQIVVILQSDITNHAPTVIVAPLLKLPRHHIVPKLNLPVEVDGKHYVIVIQELAAIPRKSIGRRLGNCAGLHSEFMAAIDLLFPGV